MRFKISLLFVGLLVVVNIFHYHLETLILKMSALKFATYVIYGLFLAFFVVLLVKAIRTGKNLEIAVLLLGIGLIFFFLFSNPRLLFKLGVFEFFILGVLAALDNKKNKSVVPFLIILGAACLIELTGNLVTGTRFYYMDVWIHSLTGLSGYIAGFLLL